MTARPAFWSQTEVSQSAAIAVQRTADHEPEVPAVPGSDDPRSCPVGQLPDDSPGIGGLLRQWPAERAPQLCHVRCRRQRTVRTAGEVLKGALAGLVQRTGPVDALGLRHGYSSAGRVRRIRWTQCQGRSSGAVQDPWNY
ncbi:MAG: hypothetical protein WKF57_05635 [Nakamurella sp.]